MRRRTVVLGAPALLLGLAIGTHRKWERIVAEIESPRHGLGLGRDRVTWEVGIRRQRWRYTRSGARC